jgi:sugar lactone lactonase YvrE
MKTGWRVFFTGLVFLVGLNGAALGQKKADYRWLLADPNRKLLSQAGEMMLLRLTGESVPEVQKIPLRPRPPALAGQPDVIAAPPTNVQVNDSGADFNESTTQSETTIAKSDATGTMVAGWNDSGEFLVNGNFTGYGRSTDGGATWTDLGAMAPLPGGNHFGDPSLAVHHATGVFYFATLAADQSGRSVIGVGRSLDDGETFEPQVDASPGLSFDNFQDKELIAVDNSGGDFDGNVYVAWTEFSFFGVQMRFSRSVDGGESFSDPIALNEINFGTSGAFPLVAPNGDVYVFWENELVPGIEFVKSTDGGESFSEPALVATLNLTGEFGPSSSCGRPALHGFIRTQDFPRAAADFSEGPNNGNIYVVYNSKPSANDESDILFTRSTDGGATWSEPLRVNDDVTNRGNFFPEIAVNASGEIGVAWYDRRNSPANLDIEYFSAFSTDGGLSFGSNQKITDLAIPGFPPAVNFDPITAQCYMGEYNAITNDGDDFLFLWGDNRNVISTPFFPDGRNDPDIFFARQAASLAPIPSPPSALAAVRANGDVDLNWSDPTTNTDGTALTDLDHINIYRSFELVGSAAAGVETFTDAGAPSGLARYVVTAVNSAGEESAISNAVLLATPAELGVLYASTGRADGGNLLTIDTNTGAGALIGPTGLGFVPALAINPQGEMYGIQELSGNLFRIDAATGESELVANTGLFAIEAMAFDNDGVLYAADFGIAGSNIYTIDINTGAPTLIGRSSEYFAGLAFDPTDGTLWGSSGGLPQAVVVPDGIYTIDPLTAQATLVGTTGFGDATPDIAIDIEGNLFGAKGGGRRPNFLISIDKSNGSGALVGDIGFFAVSGMSFRPQSPEGPNISVIPRAINFGKTLVGQTSPPRRLIIRSIGTEDLTVSAIDGPAAPFAVSGVPTLPVVLAPGDTIELKVTFSPEVAGVDSSGEIVIASDDIDPPDQIRTVPLSGDGREPAPAGTRLFIVDGLNSTINEIEPITGVVLNSIPTPEPTSAGPDGLAFDGNSLFFVNGFGSNMIYELDPVTGDVRNSFPAPNGGGLDALAHSGFSLFGLSFNNNTVFEMDPATGEVLNSFVPAVQLVGGISFGGSRGTLFVTENFQTIHELDPFSGAVLRTFFGPGPDILGLGYSDNFQVLFAGGADGRVYLLNPENGRIIDFIPVATVPSALAADEFLPPGPHILVFPGFINFGKVLIGSTRSLPLTIRSIGTEELIVSDIFGLEEPFGLSEAPELPLVIPPRQLVTFFVTFSPTSEEAFEGSLVILSNALEGDETVVPVRGAGAVPPPPGTLFAAAAGGSNRFVMLNPATGAGTFVGLSDTPVGDMDFSADGTLFGSTSDGSSRLVIIDFFSGAQTVIGQHTSGVLSALEFAPDSTLIGCLTSIFGGFSELVRIDPRTAALELIGFINFEVGGLAFGSDGTLYGATAGVFTGGNLIKIDILDGGVETTLIGPTGFSDIASLEFSPEGVLFGGLGEFDVNPGGLITIDPASGAGAFVGVSGFPSLSGLAFFPGIDFPDPVEISGFTAVPSEQRVVLTWNVASQSNLKGFNLWRSQSQAGERAQLNDELIVGDGAFSFEDHNVQAGVSYFYFLEALYHDGAAETVGEISAQIELPKEFLLTQNFPNPFNPDTQIKFELPLASEVSLRIYDIRGRLVRVLLEREEVTAGFHRAAWNGRDDAGVAAASGVYFYSLIAQPRQKSERSFHQTKKMTLLK